MKIFKDLFLILIISTIFMTGCAGTVDTTTASDTSPIVGTWVWDLSATLHFKKVFKADGTYINSVKNGSLDYVQTETGTYTYINMPGVVKSLVCISSTGSTVTYTGVGVSSTKLVFGLYCLTEPSDLVGTWNGIISKTGAGASNYNQSDGYIIGSNSIALTYVRTGSSADDYTVSATLSSLNISAGSLVISASSDLLHLPNGIYYFAMADGVISKLSQNSTYLSSVYIKQ